MWEINFTENEILQERKKRKLRDTGTDDSHNHYSESMTLTEGLPPMAGLGSCTMSVMS